MSAIRQFPRLDTLLDTGIDSPQKGELLVSDGDAWVNLPVGANGKILMLDNSEPSGLKWITPEQATSGYVHTQLAPSALWTIVHGLNRFPSVSVVDSGGSVVIGDVLYVDENTIEATFTATFGGKAYLN